MSDESEKTEKTQPGADTEEQSPVSALLLVFERRSLFMNGSRVGTLEENFLRIRCVFDGQTAERVKKEFPEKLRLAHQVALSKANRLEFRTDLEHQLHYAAFLQGELWAMHAFSESFLSVADSGPQTLTFRIFRDDGTKWCVEVA